MLCFPPRPDGWGWALVPGLNPLLWKGLGLRALLGAELGQKDGCLSKGKKSWGWLWDNMRKFSFCSPRGDSGRSIPNRPSCIIYPGRDRPPAPRVGCSEDCADGLFV